MTVSPAFKIELVDYKFRLDGIDCYELNSTDEHERELARTAKQIVSDLVLNKPVMVKSIKNTHGAEKIDSFGRYLVEIWYQDEDGDWVCLNEMLLKLELARFWSKK